MAIEDNTFGEAIGEIAFLLNSTASPASSSSDDLSKSSAVTTYRGIE